ncbi:MAG: molybdopterin-dependent oxidoreductase [Verrucomicrobiota bacterium]|nr:molybdopterin-dependent oxidoreductase [Verrucomicrobiota bacterium]
MNTKSDLPASSKISTGKRLGAGLIAGIVAGLVMTTVMLLLMSGLRIATPLTIMGDRLSVFFDVDTFLRLMGRLGGYNNMKELGVGSVMLGQIVLGAIGGAIYGLNALKLSRGGRRALSIGLFIILPMVAVAAALWPVLATSYSGYPMRNALVITLVGLLVSFIAFERTLVIAFHGLVARSRSLPANVEFSPPIARRTLLLGALGLLVAGGGAAILRKLYRAATFSYDGTQYVGETVQAITPNEQFYCVTKNVIDPVVDQSVWRLEVNGLVEHRQTYKMDRLRGLPSITQETTLMCISNGIGAGLMSNALWKGVTMKTLLESASPRPEATRVVLHGVDNYVDTIPLAKALDPQTLIAYEMNGAALPSRHGFPARAIVPGYFGEKHVKWITRIELATDDKKGFYEKQGWGPDFTVPTRSRIDLPPDQSWTDGATAANGVKIRGVAFGGDHGISRVEVSSDDGKTWAEAKIDYPGTPLTWALWSYDWRPPGAGTYTLVVRATNGDGQLQAFDPNRPTKSGVTGFHKVTSYIG